MRRFEGWEPRTITRHKYRRGRLVRSVAEREPEFNEDDQAWFLALATCRQLTCDGCAGWLPDTTVGEVEDWTVPAPWRCKRCTAIAFRQEVYAEQNKHVHATRWTAERRQVDGEPLGLG